MKTINNYIKEVLVHGDFGKNAKIKFVFLNDEQTVGLDKLKKYRYTGNEINMNGYFTITEGSILFVKYHSGMRSYFFYFLGENNDVLVFAFSAGKFAARYYVHHNMTFDENTTGARIVSQVANSYNGDFYKADRDTCTELHDFCEELTEAFK